MPTTRKPFLQCQSYKMLSQDVQNKNLLALPDTVPVVKDRVGLVLVQLCVLLLYQGVRHRRSPQLEPLGCRQDAVPCGHRSTASRASLPAPTATAHGATQHTAALLRRAAPRVQWELAVVWIDLVTTRSGNQLKHRKPSGVPCGSQARL